MRIFDKLNPEQQEAVRRTEGPVLILAGAGSGKTRVITHRIAYLLEERGVNPWNILAITFTNKAAGEMRERVDAMIGHGAAGVWISTFHSLCVRILRRHIDLLGYETNFAIYDTDDQKTLMKEVCARLNIDTKKLKERQILSAISSAKNELITPLRFREEAGTDYYQRRIGECYEEYQKALKKNNALDFDDLLMKAVELFTLHEQVLVSYQNRFRYIMVDEYQDTNHAQYELVRLLASASRNLCVVGDDDQSIYRFRGADISNILDFEKDYPEALVVRLEQNYRSSQTILDAANSVIRNNERRKDKRLWTDRGQGEKIRFRRFATAYEEASFVAEDIEGRIRKDKGASYKDFAVLYRTNAQSRLIEDRLVLSSIPYNVVGGTNFYDRKEIRDVLAYLKTVDNARDDLAVRRILNVPRRGIGQTTISRVAAFAVSEDMTFYEAMLRVNSIPGIGRAASKIRAFTDMIEGFRAYGEDHRLSDLLGHILEESGYKASLEDSDDENAEDRIRNVEELFSKLADYEEHDDSEEGPSLSGFLEEVALVADIDSVEDSDNRVLLMTLHSAKGLEFPHVYITGLEDGVFPSAMAMDEDGMEGEEEERRLAYVGITRAREDLTLTAAQSRMARGEVRFNPESRFLSEIPADLMDDMSARGRRASARARDFYDDIFSDEDAPPFEEGGRITSLGAYAESLRGKKARVPETSPRKEEPGKKGGLASLSGIPGLQKGAAGLKSPAGTGAKPAGSKPRAVYVKPHTAEEKLPYITRASRASAKKQAAAAPAAPDYGPGDRVRHQRFGEGTVLSVTPGPRDYKVAVEFDSCGRKVMYAAFAGMEKI